MASIVRRQDGIIIFPFEFDLCIWVFHTVFYYQCHLEWINLSQDTVEHSRKLNLSVGNWTLQRWNIQSYYRFNEQFVKGVKEVNLCNQLYLWKGLLSVKNMINSHIFFLNYIAPFSKCQFSHKRGFQGLYFVRATKFLYGRRVWIYHSLIEW
jgi:hypothetical protein